MTNPFNRQWQPLPSGTTIKDIFDPAQGVKAIIGSLQNAQVTGQEKVGGAQTWHVEGTIQSDALTTAVPIAEPGLTVDDRSLDRRRRLPDPPGLPRRAHRPRRAGEHRPQARRCPTSARDITIEPPQ